ncbi:MAG: hypothetical protein PHV99_01245 [Candidatus Pacebacteria bacterium]|nr:hypothetical protein [Candidatus Paceibacterota bacterium]
MKSPLSQLVVVSVMCAVTLIGYGLWYSVVSSKSAKVAELQNSITAKTETVNRIAATRATLASIASDEAVVQGYFVPEASVVAFIDSLQSHGRALGATVSVLSVSTVGTAVAPSLALSLTVSGTFDAMMRTIGSIEHSPYALSVSLLDIVQDGKGSWHASLKLLVGSRAANTP